MHSTSNIFKPSVLHPFLRAHALKAKKGLSQNFLIDGNILDKIVDAADLQPGDSVLEIGSGPGALSEKLLAAGVSLLAVEKDRRFAEELLRLQTQSQQLRVIEADILKLPLEEIPPNTKIVSNLPYHITTPILTRFAPLYPHIVSITAMVQKEMGRRCTVEVGSKDYSSLSIFLKYYSAPRYLFSVAPSCFYPRPNVASAVIQLSLKQPALSHPELFFQLVRTAFGKRRKMLSSSLKELYESGHVQRALESLGIDAKARPEELSLDDFLSLFIKLRRTTLG